MSVVLLCDVADRFAGGAIRLRTADPGKNRELCDKLDVLLSPVHKIFPVIPVKHRSCIPVNIQTSIRTSHRDLLGGLSRTGLHVPAMAHEWPGSGFAQVDLTGRDVTG